MQTPVEIDFQGMNARLDIQAAIIKHVAELEQRSGRVTACRVVLKGPGGHHRKGGLYEVNPSGASGRPGSQCRPHRAGRRAAFRPDVRHQ